MRAGFFVKVEAEASFAKLSTVFGHRAEEEAASAVTISEASSLALTGGTAFGAACSQEQRIFETALYL